MADTTPPTDTPDSLTALFTDMLTLPNQIAQQTLAMLLPALQAPLTDPAEAAHWAEVAAKLQTMWLEFQAEQALKAAATPPDPSQWLSRLEGWYRQLPLLQPDAQQQLWEQGATLWQQLLGQVGLAPGSIAAASKETLTLP